MKEEETQGDRKVGRKKEKESRESIQTPTHHLSVRPCIRSSIHPSTHPHTHSFIRLSTHLSIHHSFTHSSIYLPIQLLTNPLITLIHIHICICVYPSVPPLPLESICPLIHTRIQTQMHPSIHLPTNPTLFSLPLPSRCMLWPQATQ